MTCDLVPEIFDVLSAGIIIWDANGMLQFCSTAAAGMLGITAGDLAAVAFKDFRWGAIRDDGTPLPAESHPAAVALQTGMPVSGVILGIPNANGSLTWLSVNS